MFLVDKEIASARAEFVKRDACQVRPMARCPSVPSDGFQPASQRALSVDRGSEPSVPHTIHPLKPHSLDVLLYHLCRPLRIFVVLAT